MLIDLLGQLNEQSRTESKIKVNHVFRNVRPWLLMLLHRLIEDEIRMMMTMMILAYEILFTK